MSAEPWVEEAQPPPGTTYAGWFNTIPNMWGWPQISAPTTSLQYCLTSVGALVNHDKATKYTRHEIPIT